MSAASFGVSSLTTVTGVVQVVGALIVTEVVFGAATSPCCRTAVCSCRLAFAADDPLSGTTQTNAMVAKKKSVPMVTRAVVREDVFFIS
jgi:hypothetical protein